MTKAAGRRRTGSAQSRSGSFARDESAIKRAVVEAALPRIPFDGYTDKVLEAAAREAGLRPGEVNQWFPRGPLSLVEAFSDIVDRDMETRLAEHGLSRMKVRDRIAHAIKTRISILKPHKEAARRAAAFLTLPPHAARATVLLYRTVDAMWRAAGDTSTDFNFYTKRAILAGVYSATLMRWFTDDSKDEAETEAFLARRIDDVMRFEKFKAQVRKRAEKLPSLSDIFQGPRATRS